MEKIACYKEIIEKELTEQVSKKPANAPDLVQQLIINKERTQFLVMILGWHDYECIHSCLFHVEIKDGLIYIHEDNTDIVLAEKLVDNGIPPSFIVPAFLPVYERELSAFA